MSASVSEMGVGGNSRDPVWGAPGVRFDPDLHAGGASGGSAAALALRSIGKAPPRDLRASVPTEAAAASVV